MVSVDNDKSVTASAFVAGTSGLGSRLRGTSVCCVRSSVLLIGSTNHRPSQELCNTPGPECISSMGNNSNRLDRYSSKNCDQIFQNMTELDSLLNELFRYANSQLTNIYVQYRREV